MELAKTITTGLSGVVVLAWLSGSAPAAEEVHLTSGEFEQLDTFEGHRLTKADKLYNKKDYRRAAAEYDTFMKEFPKSKALPYAILRMGRSLEYGNKRYQAVKVYNEILDYFPNAVGYAAPALYYTGQCHWHNGEVAKAMKAWAEMADDVDYSKHYLAASAINRLAENLDKQGKAREAVKYYKQVALDFRKANHKAARHAIDKVVAYYVRADPDEPKLREFYVQARAFGDRRRKIRGDVSEDRHYWDCVRGIVKRHGRFAREEDALKKRYYSYWVSRVAGKFPESDDFQKDVADWHLAADGNPLKWAERLDAQFERHRTPGDYRRVLKWMGFYHGNKPKMMEYYNKLVFEKMSNNDIRRLMDLLRRAAQHDMAKNAFFKIRLSEMDDREKVGLARDVWRYGSRDMLETVWRSIKDRELGKMEMLRYHHWKRDLARGLPLTKELSASAKYARDVIWFRAELFHWNRKYQEAINAYQQADRPPENLWRISDCYASMRKLAEAVQQLREVEGFFKDHAPEAVLRIAHLYKRFKKRPEHIAALREIMKKYPKSGQSRQAHVELEALGVRIGGAVDAEH